ncbi:hypothetical protein FACS18949_11690 [Clostridia bacterium]|nr:hypothetical protein FACS189425_06560 [Clostridia bacterium]GHV34863.1 hypothetical protein FACS18949_11690 [Clostridia bacterium]
MSLEPVISVIIPVLKVEPYLEQCLDSVLQQTMGNFEVICSYTKSPDKSLNILTEYSKKDDRIKIVFRDDGGLGGARNYGLTFARGQYVFFLDSDDWIAPDALHRLTETATRLNADMVMFAVQNYDDETKQCLHDNWCYTLQFPRVLEGQAFAYTDLKPEDFVSSNAPVAAWNKLYSRKFIENSNLRFPEGLRFEDNPFYYEAVVCAERIAFLQERLYFYRVNRTDSLQQKSNDDKSLFDIIPIMKSICDTLEKHNVPQKYRDALLSYMMDEFAWRYQAMTVSKNEFLSMVKSAFSQFEYNAFLSKLRSRGEVVYDRDPLKRVKISIIIPVYNTEKYIRACLMSVLTQTVRDIEVICVNDCSTDNSAEVVNDIQNEDARVVLLENKHNSGPGFSRNAGLSIANGDFIFFLDADDLIGERFVLEKLYFACIHNRVQTAAGNMVCFTGDIDKTEEYCGYHFDVATKMKYSEYAVFPTWGFTRFLYGFEIIQRNQIQFPENTYYEDPAFFVSYMSMALDFYALPINVYFYRQSNVPKQMHKKHFIDLFDNMHKILPKLRAIDLSLYYTEYEVFLNFCKHTGEYIAKKSRDKTQITAMANRVFSELDFDNYKGFLTEDNIFHSFEETVYGKSGGRARMSRSGDGFKRLIKKIAMPVYRVFCSKMIQIVRTENNAVRASMAANQKEIVGLKNDNYIAQISRLLSAKNVFLVGTPEYGNIGDSAITLGTYAFIRKYLADYGLFEISGSKSDERYNIMRTAISAGDLILLQGGGNLGDMYLAEENIRRRVISDFSNNKIIILPQTIHFNDVPGDELTISKTIYNAHKDLTIFTRGEFSLNFAKEHFYNVKSFLYVDMAHMLRANYSRERDGLLLCIRDLDDESGLAFETYNSVFSAAKAFDSEYKTISHQNPEDIPVHERGAFVMDTLKLYSESKIVVTDRLHGMIFSIVTQTPCVVICAETQKLREYAEMFSECTGVIFIDKDMDKLPKAMEAAEQIGTTHYPLLNNEPFEQMARIIAGERL